MRSNAARVAAAAAATKRENRNMHIDTEAARLAYLPDSQLFAWLDQFYTDELEFRVNGNPHEVTPAELVAELESDQIDPLGHDWHGPEDDQLSPMWADLGYPLPEEADELAHAVYGITPSDIVREALREYANLFAIEPVAERVIEALREEYDRDNSSSN